MTGLLEMAGLFLILSILAWLLIRIILGFARSLDKGEQ
jgi:uncharacterized membrane protein